MENKNKLPWILSGYEIFAQQGPTGLKVEVISRKVNKSKSSFYHHFADMEVFTEHLLNYHMEQSKLITNLASSCKSVDPELINALLEVKLDLFFNKQLRMNRRIESYKLCFQKANNLAAGAFISLFEKDLALNNNIGLAKIVFDLVLENFYLQLTEENLTYTWLSNYFKEIKLMVAGIKNI